jgi:hypothetical protein
MSLPYQLLSKMDPDQKQKIIHSAASFLDQLRVGKP